MKELDSSNFSSTTFPDIFTMSFQMSGTMTHDKSVFEFVKGLPILLLIAGMCKELHQPLIADFLMLEFINITIAVALSLIHI